MKEKNVKGITGLCFGLIAIVFAALSMIPMIQLTGMGLNGEISFFGQINIVFSLCTLVSAVIAVIFGAMSKKDDSNRSDFFWCYKFFCCNYGIYQQ